MNISRFRGVFVAKTMFLGSNFHHLLVFFIVFSISQLSYLSAQSNLGSDINLLIEDFIEGRQDDGDFELIEIYENINDAAQNPRNLNTVSADELRNLFVISEVDINKIISHRERFGPFADINELQAVQGIEISTLRLLSKLTYVSDGEIKPLAQIQSNTEVLVKLRRELETRRGFRSFNCEDPVYAGSPNYLLLRINHKNDQKLSYNLTLEKDAGESFSNTSVGFDYISGYLHKRDLSKHLRSVTLGDYSIRMGEGLLLNNGFSFGKSIASVNIKAGGYQVKPYTSTIENLAFRGIATQWRVKNLEIMNFVSYRTLDANQTTDDFDQPIVSSLQTSGFHRSESEIFDRDAVNNLSAGLSVNYRIKSTSIGINGLSHQLSVPLIRTDSEANRFRFSGDHNYGASIDYNTTLKGLYLFGEVGISNGGAIAQSHGLMTSLNAKLDLALHVRNFDRDFQALYSNTFSETRRSENETGQYIGLEYRPSKPWKINVYADFYKHPWLRFLVDSPSDGTEYLVRATYNLRRKRTLFWQYRYERKQRNSSQESNIDRVVDTQVHRARIQLNEEINPNLELRTRVEASWFTKESELETGLLAYQDVIYDNSQSPIKLAGRFMYFNVSDFDARIWAYESDLRYEFSIPFFSGTGLRYYLRASYRTRAGIIFEARLSQTNFLDGREMISSGNNEILGSTQTQLKAQVRYRF
jgi:hypothetical protein